MVVLGPLQRIRKRLLSAKSSRSKLSTETWAARPLDVRYCSGLLDSAERML
jgi:hypothetical protein